MLSLFTHLLNNLFIFLSFYSIIMQLSTPFYILSLILYIFLIFLILIQSPNEQSFKNNLALLKIFKNTKEVEKSLEKLSIRLIFLFFSLALFFNIYSFF
uniref:Probable protein-export membrane protein SecG n=1 Tax=Phaeophyceae sp. TaxID=2249243 RepID=A0A8E5BGY0_9PHAE|nr:preprotein translocase SecG subunit [Phaeophyceae sp.]